MNQRRLPWGRLLIAATTAVAVALGASAVVTVSAANSTISTSPVNINPAPLANSNFTITVTENTAATTTGAQSDLTFNPTYFQINPGTVVYGSGYTAANWAQTAGTSGQTLAQAITEANTTGTLKNVAAYVNGPPGTATLAPGQQTFFTVQFHTQPGYNHQAATFTPGNTEVLDANGNSNVVTSTGTTTGSVGGFASLPTFAGGGNSGSGISVSMWIALVAVLGAAAVFGYRRISPRGARA